MDIKTIILFLACIFCLKIGNAQFLNIYIEKKDTVGIQEFGTLELTEGDIEHMPFADSTSIQLLLAKIGEHINNTNNGNILIYIHGMMAHSKWYQKNVHKKLASDIFLNESNEVDLVISLVWFGTMNYKGNQKSAYGIGKSYFPLVNKIAALSSGLDPDRKIHFMMHSMGSRTFQGLYDAYLQKPSKPAWIAENLIFVASDAPEDAFYENGKFQDFEKFANHVYIYQNAHDFTLGLSREINKQGRIGLDGISRPKEVSENITVINVSKLDDNENGMKLTGHRYHFESPTVRRHILGILNSNMDLIERWRKDSVLDKTYHLIK